MKLAFFLAPNVALCIVLYRMLAANLWRERPAVFWFLVAWCLYSFAALGVAQVLPVRSDAYALFFFLSTGFVWLFGVPALFQACARIAPTLRSFLLLAPGLLVAAGLTLLASRLAWPNLAGIAHTANVWICVSAGTLLLVASIGAAPPDSILWRGAGTFFFFYGACPVLARALAREYETAALLVTALGAVIWAALAWHIAPRGDVLVNPERLAIAAGFRFQVLGFIRRNSGGPHPTPDTLNPNYPAPGGRQPK